MPTKKIKDETLQFLTDFMTDLNTQNNYGTATPCYYSIKTNERKYGMSYEYTDNYEWVQEGEILGDDEDLANQAIDLLLEELEEQDTPIIDACIQNNIIPNKDIIKDITPTYFEGSMDALGDVLECSKVYYTSTEVLKHVFLTEMSARQHLIQNKHHYSPDADVFTIHFWRNPLIKKLYEAIGEVTGVPFIKK